MAKGQLLERLGRPAEAARAYDDAARRAARTDDKRAALLSGAELALKRGDAAGALSLSQAAWALARGNPEIVVVLAEAASRLGRIDLVKLAERETQAAGNADRVTRETLANALYRLGRYSEAALRFGELADTADSPADEYRLRRAAGFAAQAAKDPARALSQLQRAAAINPEPETLSAATEAALQGGRLDVAASQLRRLADLSGGKERTRALERLSVVEEQRNRFEQARAALDQIPPDQRNAEIERRSAVLAAKGGNQGAAVDYAGRLAQLEPTRANLRALGEAELAAGQPGAAAASLEKALAAAPEEDPSLREMLANSLAAAGQPDRAAQVYDALATRAKWPDDEYRLRLATGFAELKSGDPERALTAFRQAELLDPSAAKPPSRADEYRLRLAEGFAALQSNDQSRALKAFRQAVEIEATQRSLEAAVDAALRAGRLAEASGYLERLASAERDRLGSAQYLERLSIVYEIMGRIRELAAALAGLPHLVQTKPEIIRRRAVLAQKLGDRKGMLVQLRELAATDPSAENYAALADAEIGAGQTGAAAATLETLLGNRTLLPEARAGYLERLGNIEAARGDPKRAELLFAEAYRLSPGHPAEWLAQTAESAIQAKDWAHAAQYYRSLLENPRIPRKTRAGYAARLGFAFASMLQQEQALQAYQVAAQLSDASPSLHAQRGAVLMRLGRASEAASEFRAAYDANPRADLALSLGYAYQAAHQPGPAIVFFRRALAGAQLLSPAQRQQASAALGYAYSETEQYSLAAGCFERALGRPRSATNSGCNGGSEMAATQ